MKEWFLRFTPREQLALLGILVLVTVYLIMVLAVMPMRHAREQLTQTNMATADVLQRVDSLASALIAQREGTSAPARSRNLTSVLNSSAVAAGLRISRLQPNSRGAVQLRLEGVPFAALLRWLHELETAQGLLLEELSVSPGGAPGIVSASLRVIPSL